MGVKWVGGNPCGAGPIPVPPIPPVDSNNPAADFFREHDEVRQGLILTTDVLAIGASGTTAATTDVAAVAGFVEGPGDCVAGYAAGYTASTHFRIAGNVLSGVSATLTCLGASIDNCEFSIALT